jgi:hypothetical protein
MRYFYRIIPIIAILMLGIHYSSPPSGFTQTEAALISKIVLKVNNKSQAADDLVKKANALGGYFALLTDKSIKLKIPALQLKSFLSFVEKQGVIADRDYESIYLGEMLGRKQASLKSKETVLKKYLEVLNQAEDKSIFFVEKEVVKLIQEIETLKGEIRVIKHRLKFAEVNVSFEFRDRKAPSPDGRSSFPWLNTLNLVDMVKDF